MKYSQEIYGLVRALEVLLRQRVQSSRVHEMEESGILADLLSGKANLGLINRSSLHRDAFRATIGLVPQTPMLEFTVRKGKFAAFAKELKRTGLSENMDAMFEEALDAPVAGIKHRVYAVEFAPDVTCDDVEVILEQFKLHIAFPSDFVGALWALNGATPKIRAGFLRTELVGGIDGHQVKDWKTIEMLPYVAAAPRGSDARLVTKHILSKPRPSFENARLMVCSCSHK